MTTPTRTRTIPIKTLQVGDVVQIFKPNLYGRFGVIEKITKSKIRVRVNTRHPRAYFKPDDRVLFHRRP